MGVAAAVGVAIAVLIALTLLPALLGFAGAKLRPKQKVAARRSRRPGEGRQRDARAATRRPGLRARPATPRVGLARRWVRLVTKVPVLTVVLVLVAAGRDGLPGQGPADRPAQQRPRPPRARPPG